MCSSVQEAYDLFQKLFSEGKKFVNFVTFARELGQLSTDLVQQSQFFELVKHFETY